MRVRADVLAAARAYVEGTELEVLVVSTGAHPLPRSGRWPHWRLLWLLVGLIAAAGIAVALDRTAFSGSQAVSSAPKDVQNSVQALVGGSVPGALLFVRQGDRSYTVTAGYAEKAKKTPMRAGDTFPIGSTTKTFTAVLVMRLVAQGKIALDDPVSKYLPGLLPDGKRITIRELLSHTSGLPEFVDDPLIPRPLHARQLRLRLDAEADGRLRGGQPAGVRARHEVLLLEHQLRRARPARGARRRQVLREAAGRLHLRGRSSWTTRASRRATRPCRTSTVTSGLAPAARPTARGTSTALR